MTNFKSTADRDQELRAPTADQIERAMRDARKLRAEAFRDMWRSFAPRGDDAPIKAQQTGYAGA